MIRILAHRGASEYAPENTLAAFYMALDMRANGIETDLRMSKDGQIILFHDRDLSPKTNARGSINDYNWNELKELDAGSWFSDKYKGERLLRLDDFLYYFARRDLFFDIELKEAVDYEKLIYLLHLFDMGEKATITSKIYEVLSDLRKTDKNIKTGYLVGALDDSVLSDLEALKAIQVCPNINMISKEDVMLFGQKGYIVRAHKIKSKEIMLRALEIGVDGMTINFPDVLVKHLEKEKSK